MNNLNRKFLRLTYMCALLLDIWATDSIAYETFDDGCKSCHADFKYNNHNQHIDGDGGVCDSDTIYGTISGDIQAGVTVDLCIVNCGGNIDGDSTVTNSEGYYAIGDLVNGQYLVFPKAAGYSFAPVSVWADISNGPSQSYDFTATTDWQLTSHITKIN
jgi:hypothetical protein